ncbi:MAG: hypothetical protein WBD40_22490 [Tepidisphaeraceae bacterium]
MNWVQAFARQAASDLDVREVLAATSAMPSCHALHHLQMACEKLCKASMIVGGTDPAIVQSSHAYIARQLPILVRNYMNREAGRVARNNWIVRAIRPLARRIELLNPAVRGGGRSPQNVEYPWVAPDGSVVAPADHKFEFSVLFEPAGKTLLKILRQVAIDLQR